MRATSPSRRTGSLSASPSPAARPPASFWSSDYFSLIPWLFLFLTGFYLHGLCGKQILSVQWKGIAPLNLIGRHALEIYMVHQPVIYGLLLAWNALLRPLFM